VTQRLDTFRKPREQPWIDVWTRTAPKYRRRAVVLLIVTAVLFAGLCIFTFWLRTGTYVPWTSADYWRLMKQSLNPVGENQVTLVDFLTFPISVEEAPIQIVIMGLLLASLASIPILVGILYRFPFSLIFCAMIALLAAMPWFAATIALGCYAASGQLLRMRFRYASAIVGLLPIVVYFIMATRQPRSAYAAATPYGFKLYLPWVLAVLGSCVISAAGLGIAKLINYRPGGIAPVLAALFAVPVVLFHTQVGRDELEYRLLEHRYGPNSTTAFLNRDLRRSEAQEAENTWKRAKTDMFGSILRTRIAEQTKRAYDDLADDRAATAVACDEFIENFKWSRYVPCVLYIKGRALDQRINAAVLADEDRIEHVSDVPSEQSRPVWELLATKFGDTVPADVAENKLAILNLRAGDITAAEAVVRAVIDRHDPTTTQPTIARSDEALVTRSPPWSTLDVDPTAELLRARRLREVIACCRDELPAPFDEAQPDLPSTQKPMVHPLAAMASLDPHDPHYSSHLTTIADSFPWSGIRPYIAAQLALLDPSPTRRIERLTFAEKAFGAMPGSAVLLLRHADALKESARYAEAAQMYSRLTEKYPDSCWAGEAHERLIFISMLTRPG